jgi:hypothetical protein
MKLVLLICFPQTEKYWPVVVLKRKFEACDVHQQP